MRPEDIPAVQQAARRTWSHTYDGVIPEPVQEKFLARAYSEAALERRMERDFFLVAEIDGEIVGFADFQPISRAEVYLGAIYVLPGHQSVGVGQRLLKAGIEKFPMSAKITLNVERGNDRARRFYEAHGFRVIGGSTEDLFGHESHELRMTRDPWSESSTTIRYQHAKPREAKPLTDGTSPANSGG